MKIAVTSDEWRVTNTFEIGNLKLEIKKLKRDLGKLSAICAILLFALAAFCAILPAQTSRNSDQVLSGVYDPATQALRVEGLGGSGSTLVEVNSTSATTQSPINFENGTGITLANPSAGNITVTLNPASASVIGGVESITCAAHMWLSQISTSGVPSCLQPSFSDISGTATLGQLPATLAQFTGTITAGNCAKWSSSGVLADAGAACGAGAGITAVNGTANQITAATASGVVTLSLPSTVTLPGTLSATSVTAGGSTAGCLTLNELPTNGTNYIQLCSPATVAASTSWTWPAADGTSGQVLSTNGSGVLGWITPSGGSANAIINNPSATQTITPSSASVTGLIVNSAASPTGDLFDVDSNGTRWLTVSSTGVVNVLGIIEPFGSATLSLYGGSSASQVVLGTPGGAMLRMIPSDSGAGAYAQISKTYGNNATVEVPFLATVAATSIGQLVCLDTANANSVVTCPTTTTFQFIGFDTHGNLGGQGYYAVSGVVTWAISDGTAACALGNPVVASAADPGDIKCVTSQPASGTMVGFATTTAPATGGSLVDVLIDKR